MKAKTCLAVLFVACILACGGSDTSTSEPQRELILYNLNGKLYSEVNRVRYSFRGAFDEVGPIPLAEEDLSVRYDDGDVQPETVVPIPAGKRRFVLFNAPSTVPRDENNFEQYAVRAVPDRPVTGVRLTAFAWSIPSPVQAFRGPFDMYLLPKSVSPQDGTPFATNVLLGPDEPLIRDFPVADGKWYIWLTRVGDPRATIAKTVPFDRLNRTSVLLQTSSSQVGIYVSR
jgi:hypothetical protein